MVRVSRATATGGVRYVSISDCPITQWFIADDRDEKLIGKSFKNGGQIAVTVMEAKPGELHWKEDPEKIGALSREHPFCNVYLPLGAFAHFWNGAEGSDNNIELELRSDGSDVFAVTNIGFFEGPGSHPVVAAMLRFRDDLKTSVDRSSKLVLFAIYGALAVWVLSKIFRWNF